MKILITGAAGFIASHISDAYINDGHEVVVIDNLSTGKQKNLNPNARFYEMDIGDARVAEIFEKERPDVLNHHAAQIDVRISVADPKRDISTNVMGLVNLMEAARKNGLKKVVFASSGGTVYGEQEEFPATEKHATWPISPYGLNKLMSEKYLYYYQKEYGIPYVALRYANIYGPRQSPHGEAGVVAIFINKILAGDTPIINGDGKQTRDYVFVADVVEANRLALSYDPRKTPSPLMGEGWDGGEYSSAFNIGTGVETDVNAIFSAIREITNSKCKEMHGPAKSGEQQRSVLSYSKIEKELGWTPKVNFLEGMKKTVEWFSKEF